MKREHGQAMVEFALVGPMLLLLLLIGLDFGRGIFYYTEIAEGAREAARQAVLQYNQDSNALPGDCVGCQVPGVVPQIRRLAAFGYTVVYADSASTLVPPSYGASYVAATCTTAPCDQPGTLTLANTALVNTVYVFVYELDPSNGNAIWAQSSGGTTPVRTGAHRKVVVDLKVKFQPYVLQFAGLGSFLLLDAQTVQREEYS